MSLADKPVQCMLSVKDRRGALTSQDCRPSRNFESKGFVERLAGENLTCSLFSFNGAKYWGKLKF